VSTASAAEANRIFRRVSATFLDGSRTEGSGYIADEPGLVVTCAHVIKGNDGSIADRIKVFDLNGHEYDASPRNVDSTVDLATLDTAPARRILRNGFRGWTRATHESCV
jgi:S1-C subfamily serine protease